MTNKNILITGASQGLGAEMAKILATDGYRIFVNCAHNIAKARTVVEYIAAAGGCAEAIQCDVADTAAVGEMFAVLADRGGVDILINNARIDPYKRPDRLSDADWFDRVVGVNQKGPYLCSLAALEQMTPKGWGRIVNVSSVWAYRAASRPLMEYAMTKAAMHSLTRSLAGIVGPYGITVNTIAPGLIVTDELENRWTPEKRCEIEAAIPVRRGAAATEVTAAVKFVIDNAYLCGETININGGVYMP